ncbi:MAG: STAS domain-containing protein [Propionibacteriales bacterium]|nr:STAS domain-containing protein [Propionibacteriales bacterium]
MVVGSAEAQLITVGSHLDGRNVGQVRTTVNVALESCAGDVVVDMRGVSLIDAAGLAMLTAAHLRAERAGRRLVLRNCSDDLRRVFAVTHLSRILNIDRSLQLSV